MGKKKSWDVSQLLADSPLGRLEHSDGFQLFSDWFHQNIVPLSLEFKRIQLALEVGSGGWL
jgi:hypothetical protein